MNMLAGSTPRPVKTLQNFSMTATLAMILGSMPFIFMATFVAAHALLDLKMAFHAASAVPTWASCMAMASMFAWTWQESTSFCSAA